MGFVVVGILVLIFVAAALMDRSARRHRHNLRAASDVAHDIHERRAVARGSRAFLYRKTGESGDSKRSDGYRGD